MSGETFAVVTIDGREHPAVDLDTIKKWYLEKNLNDDSLIFSSEAGDWRLLSREFDIPTWTRGPDAPAEDVEPPSNTITTNQDYFEEITSLAVPPDADFQTVHRTVAKVHAPLAKPKKKGIPGMTALVTLAVFGVFALIAYLVLVNFVFYEETVSYSNAKEITALKTHVTNKPFDDPSGVRINLPAGWNMVSPNMPEAKVQAPEAKMFAVNFDKKMFSTMEIISLAGAKVDLKAKMSELLQRFRKNSTGPFSVIADTDMQIGQLQARKSIFARKDKEIDASTTTHLIIAQDKNNLFVFQIWSPSDKYASLVTDFDQAEKALSLP